MIFPSFEEFVEMNKRSFTNSALRQLSPDSDTTKLIDLVMYRGDEDVEDENLASWEIVSVSPTLIEIDLTFHKSLYVSQGYESDRLIV